MLIDDWRKTPLMDRLESYKYLELNHICMEARGRLKEHNALLYRTKFELTRMYRLNPIGNNKEELLLLRDIDKLLEKK